MSPEKGGAGDPGASWTWRVVDADGNVVQESNEPIVLEMTTQLGDTLGLDVTEEN